MSKNIFSAYFIFNYLLIIIYPILRNSGNKYMLKRKDNWGYQREDSIFTILVTIILLRYIRYFSNWDKFLCEIFFYSKFAISILLFLLLCHTHTCIRTCACELVISGWGSDRKESGHPALTQRSGIRWCTCSCCLPDNGVMTGGANILGRSTSRLCTRALSW